MNQSISFSRLTAPLLIIAIMAVAALAQTETKPQTDRDLDLTLQVLTAGSEPGSRAELPSNLASVARQLKAELGIANLRLASTFLGRTSTNGGFEYKSITESLSPAADGEPPTFLEWSVNGVRTGGSGIYAQSFRFGARVPVKMPSLRDDGGKAAPMFNFESIGLSVGRLGMPEDQPILIGSLSLPKQNTTLFLVLTVRAAK
ncbi:MAG: hypothetical protein K1X36_02160 [Pyrinomonadaceae bacterium]|nr:hypothetical protein [Pyrinomonadaceae bacterium]